METVAVMQRSNSDGNNRLQLIEGGVPGNGTDMTDGTDGTGEQARNSFYDRIPEDAKRKIAGDFTPEEIELRAKVDAEWDRKKRARIITRAGFSPAMRDRTFGRFLCSDPLQRSCLATAKAFVESVGRHLAKDLTRLPEADKRRIRGLMIWGPSGCGKTHLLQSVCNAAAAELPEPPTIGYIDCAVLGTMDKRGRTEIAEVVAGAQLLAVDDLDKGLGGDAPAWARDLLKGVLVVADRDRRIKLISTTNYPLRARETPEEETEREKAIRMASCYQGQRDMPDYIIGRLDGLFHWCEMDGPNARLDTDANEEVWWSN